VFLSASVIQSGNEKLKLSVCCNFRQESSMALTDDIKEMLKDSEKEMKQ